MGLEDEEAYVTQKILIVLTIIHVNIYYSYVTHAGGIWYLGSKIMALKAISFKSYLALAI